jgi:hypothetical protein
MPEPTPTPEPAEADETRRVSARGLLVVGARTVTGLIGVAAVAATVLAATVLPLPAHKAEPPSASVTPVPAAQQRACAGPFLRLGDDTGGSATVASAIGTPQVRRMASGGTADLSAIQNTEEPSSHSAAVLTLSPDDGADGTPLLAGSQVQKLSSGDVAGLAAGECVEPRAETWLVGGSTATGRTTLLTLANPSAVAATVSIAIYSENGPVDAPGTDGIIVQPNTEVAYSLAGFAPDISSPVVHVTSVGGGIVAGLQQTTVRTLEAGGIDLAGPAAAPSTEVVIPGMVISAHDEIDALVGAPGFQDIEAVLRMFVPGTETAKTTISVTADGDEAPISVDFDLQPGVVSEFPFEHFEDGSYTVTITSSVPLVAGARASTVGPSGASDFAWFESAPRMRGQALVTVGAGADAFLHLYNDTDTAVTASLTPEGEDATDATVTIPARSPVVVPLDASSSLRVSDFASLRVAVSYAGGGLLSGYTLSPTGPAAEAITVYP